MLAGGRALAATASPVCHAGRLLCHQGVHHQCELRKSHKLPLGAGLQDCLVHLLSNLDSMMMQPHTTAELPDSTFNGRHLRQKTAVCNKAAGLASFLASSYSFEGLQGQGCWRWERTELHAFCTLCILQWLQAPPEAKLMGEQLLSNGQARFTKAAAVGAQATLGDWKVSPEVQTGSLAAGVAEIALELPTSSAAVLVQVPDRQTDTTVTVPFLDEDKLEVVCLSSVGAFLSETLLCRSVKPRSASACRQGFLSHVSSALQQSSKVVCSKSKNMPLLSLFSLPPVHGQCQWQSKRK